MRAKYDPDRHHRRSIRLKGYDYSRPGAYFITMVAQGRQCLFGEVAAGEMRLNDAGRMVERWWRELGSKYARVVPDACVVMPNHFHGIVIIAADDVVVGADRRVCPEEGAHTGKEGAHTGAPQPGPPQPGGPQPGGPHGAPQPGAARPEETAERPTGVSVPEIVQWLKTMTTNEYIRGVKTLGWTRYPGKLWQRNYYEHIIRNDTSLNRIRRYIANNPARWAEDAENPEQGMR